MSIKCLEPFPPQIVIVRFTPYRYEWHKICNAFFFCQEVEGNFNKQQPGPAIASDRKSGTNLVLVLIQVVVVGVT